MTNNCVRISTTFCSRTIFKLNKGKIRNGLYIVDAILKVILGLIDAVLECRCNCFRCWITKIAYSTWTKKRNLKLDYSNTKRNRFSKFTGFAKHIGVRILHRVTHKPNITLVIAGQNFDQILCCVLFFWQFYTAGVCKKSPWVQIMSYFQKKR